MNFKLKYYEDQTIKIEINNDLVSYTYKGGSFDLEAIEHSMLIVSILFSSLEKLNNKFQPERLNEETSKEDAKV